MIKVLGAVGTVALILVSGGIFVHNIEYLHHFLPELPDTVKEFGIGLVVGLIAFTILTVFKKVLSIVKR